MCRRYVSAAGLLATVVAAVGAGPASAAPLERLVELASGGPAGGGADSADVERVELSPDGSRLYFVTAEPLSGADNDASKDIYVFAGGAPLLVSTTPMAGGLDTQDIDFRELAPGGVTAAFVTEEPLTPDDTDATGDVYVAGPAGVELASAGTNAGGGDSDDAFFSGFAGPGPLVVFATLEPLEPADGDGTADVYSRSLGAGGATTLVSTGPLDGGGGSANASFADASDDGAAIFFSTQEPMNILDNDVHSDIYRRQGTATTLMTHGPLGGGGDSAHLGNFAGAGAAPDASNVIFFTSEKLNAADDDAVRDVYRGTGSGEPILISDGPDAGGVDSDLADPSSPGEGGHDFFSTSERVDMAADLDAHEDIYERFGGTTTLVSTGPLAGGIDSTDVEFDFRSAANGTRAYFAASEPLTSDDTDTEEDVYERSGGITTLISAAPQAGGPDSEGAGLLATSTDGSRVFFYTAEPLTADDTDTHLDVYERNEGATTLVTTGPLAGGADSTNSGIDGFSDDGTRIAFSTAEPLLAEDADATEDAYLARPPTPPVLPDTTAPVIERLSIRPRVIRRGTALPRLARRLSKRTRISFRLSEPARVGVTFRRAAPGRRVSGRCRKPTRRNRARRRCTRYVPVRGAISVSAPSGDSRLLFSGRISKRRKLAAGRRYRVTLVATDLAGNASAARSGRLRIARLAKRK
jgi:hypothetical protein